MLWLRDLNGARRTVRKQHLSIHFLRQKSFAEQNDCLPLITGLKFMKLRSESNNLKDAHVRALKRMVHEPLYNEYLQYTKQHCL